MAKAPQWIIALWRFVKPILDWLGLLDVVVGIPSRVTVMWSFGTSILTAIGARFEGVPWTATAVLCAVMFGAILWIFTQLTQGISPKIIQTRTKEGVPVTAKGIANDGREFFFGQWSVEKGNGYPGGYVVELHDDGRALKISGGMVKNVAGSWGYVNAGGWAMHGQVEIKWDDGGTDVLRVVKVGRRADGSAFEAKAIKIKGAESLAPV